MAQSSYSTRYADFRQSSFCPVALSAKGRIAWTRPLSVKSRPRFLMTWGEQVLVETETSIALYSEKGKSIWRREKANGLPVSIYESSAYYITPKYALNAINIEGQEKTLNGYIPEAPDDQFPVSLMVPQSKGFAAVVQAIGGIHEPPPQVFVHGTEYGSGLSSWELEYDGIQKMTPLFIKDRDVLAVFMQEAIMIGGTSGTEKGRFTIPMDTQLAASGGPEGAIYVLGVKENEPELCMVNAEGKVQWQLALPGLNLHRLQTGRFPAVVGSLLVYVVSSRIVAVREGKVVWSFTRDEGDFQYATALEGDLLVAAGRGMIVLIDSHGRTVFEVALEKPVCTPPVITPKGDILVATDDSLVRIE